MSRETIGHQLQTTRNREDALRLVNKIAREDKNSARLRTLVRGAIVGASVGRQRAAVLSVRQEPRRRQKGKVLGHGQNEAPQK